jgi:hypothetical protein
VINAVDVESGQKNKAKRESVQSYKLGSEPVQKQHATLTAIPVMTAAVTPMKSCLKVSRTVHTTCASPELRPPLK